MEVVNKHETVPLPSDGQRRVRGVVLRRGVDLRVRGRGVVLEQRRPVAVEVDGPDGASSYAVPQDHGETWRMLAWIAAPLVALSISRAVRKKRRR